MIIGFVYIECNDIISAGVIKFHVVALLPDYMNGLTSRTPCFARNGRNNERLKSALALTDLLIRIIRSNMET